jgi:hypothetical protein
MKSAWRIVAILLGASLVWSAAGCFTGQDYAEESGAQLAPGMTMDEVQGQLGDPHLVIKGDPGTDTVWVYRYEGGPSTALVVFMVIFFVVLIVAIVLSKSKGGGGGVFFGIGGGGGPPYQIRIHFDSTGRLMEVSPPHPVNVP